MDLVTDNKQSNNSIAIFRPSKNQKLWLKSALDPQVRPTIRSIAKDCGVPREYWYKWLKNPYFVKWFKEAWDSHVVDYGWYLDKIALEKAGKNFQYWEALNNRIRGVNTMGSTPVININNIQQNNNSVGENINRDELLKQTRIVFDSAGIEQPEQSE